MIGPVREDEPFIRSQNQETGVVAWHQRTATKDDNGCVIFEELHPAFVEEQKRVQTLSRTQRRRAQRAH